MEHRSKVNTIVICSLLVTIIMMSVGYASLSQRLDIAGTAQVTGAATNWNVHFKEFSSSKGGDAVWAADGTPGFTADTNAAGSKVKIGFGCELTLPGDYCEVTGTAINGGNLTALYEGFTLTVGATEITASTQGATVNEITGVMTYVDADSKMVITVTPAAGWEANTTKVAKNTEGLFKVRTELPSDLDELPAETVTRNVTVAVNFSQTSAD